MTVAELIAELSSGKYPQDAEVTGRYVGDYNYDFGIDSVEVEDKKWSWHNGGQYLNISPKVVLS